MVMELPETYIRCEYAIRVLVLTYVSAIFLCWIEQAELHTVRKVSSLFGTKL